MLLLSFLFLSIVLISLIVGYKQMGDSQVFIPMFLISVPWAYLLQQILFGLFL